MAVDEQEERTVLVTVRARFDPAFGGVVFISLRNYEIPGENEAVDLAEVSSIDEAVHIVRSWLLAATNVP